MNIKQIRYFVDVFESGSFSIAAKTCGVTVQAVSKAIHELETDSASTSSSEPTAVPLLRP